MDLQKLRYFYEVAKIQHVTKAAENINIAQPALTQAIKSLENELGVDLFVKKGRNIILTDCGEYLKKRLDSILPEIDSLPREMEQLRAEKNKTVKLNILAASTFVINSIVEYRKTHDEVIFDFEQNDRISDSDIVITTNSIEGTVSKGYKKRCIKNEKYILQSLRNPPTQIAIRSVSQRCAMRVL